VFPGRVESQNLYAEIVRTLSVEGMNEHVTILGELTPEDLRDWYGASALVVLPSQGEGLGRVLLEAQAMAKPVVAYAAGGMTAALRDGISGHLVRRRHFRDLAERIEPLVTDATMRREMGLRGREWVATYFSLDALAERHERFCVAATVKNHLRANVS
jgi:phosphatidylinositol alpha-1,6-mannosyltransferase